MTPRDLKEWHDNAIAENPQLGEDLCTSLNINDKGRKYFKHK